MFLVFVVGLALCLTYGIGSGEIPITAANGITLMLAGAILFFNFTHG